MIFALALKISYLPTSDAPSFVHSRRARCITWCWGWEWDNQKDLAKLQKILNKFSATNSPQCNAQNGCGCQWGTPHEDNQAGTSPERKWKNWTFRIWFYILSFYGWFEVMMSIGLESFNVNSFYWITLQFVLNISKSRMSSFSK